MKRAFKKYFIPHQDNNYRPHFLRRETAILITVLLVVFELVFFFGPGRRYYSNFFALVLSVVLVDETNNNRVGQNIPALAVNLLLEEAAKRKAQDMAVGGYFSHIGPDGKTPWEWLREAGYNYRYAGENLAVNFIDSKDVVDAWMDSPGHRANILSERYTEIGIGTATGTYKGRETVFVAQYFGRPLFTRLPESSRREPGDEQQKPERLSAIYSALTTSSKPQEELFLTVENPEAKNIGLELVGFQPAASTYYSSFLERVLVSPRATASYILLALASIIVLALTLKIFIRIELQHPPLIINGIALLVLVALAITLNKYIGLLGTSIL